MWTEEAIANWYDTPPGQKLLRALLRQFKRWPSLRWQGRQPPEVLALGQAHLLEPLWPGQPWEQPTQRSSNRFDRIVLFHSTDFNEAPDETLAACWREVTPGGLVLLIVPNKWSLARWSQTSPLGAGESWRAGSLSKLVQQAGFTCLHHQTMLPGWASGSLSWLPLPNLLRVMLLRKDEPAITRLRLKPLRSPNQAIAAAGN